MTSGTEVVPLPPPLPDGVLVVAGSAVVVAEEVIEVVVVTTGTLVGGGGCTIVVDAGILVVGSAEEDVVDTSDSINPKFRTAACALENIITGARLLLVCFKFAGPCALIL